MRGWAFESYSSPVNNGLDYLNLVIMINYSTSWLILIRTGQTNVRLICMGQRVSLMNSGSARGGSGCGVVLLLFIYLKQHQQQQQPSCKNRGYIQWALLAVYNRGKDICFFSTRTMGNKLQRRKDDQLKEDVSSRRPCSHHRACRYDNESVTVAGDLIM